MLKTLRSSIFAGIYIGTAGFGFLASGIQSETFGPLVGAILFSLGLLSVVGYKLKLYTGTAGFIQKNEVGNLFFILSETFSDVSVSDLFPVLQQWIFRVRLRKLLSSDLKPVPSGVASSVFHVDS